MIPADGSGMGLGSRVSSLRRRSCSCVGVHLFFQGWLKMLALSSSEGIRSTCKLMLPPGGCNLMHAHGRSGIRRARFKNSLA